MFKINKLPDEAVDELVDDSEDLLASFSLALLQARISFGFNLDLGVAAASFEFEGGVLALVFTGVL